MIAVHRAYRYVVITQHNRNSWYVSSQPRTGSVGLYCPRCHEEGEVALARNARLTQHHTVAEIS